MAKNGRQRRSRRVSLERARAKREDTGFDQRPERKERSLFSIFSSLILVSLLLGSIVFYILHERSKNKPTIANNSPNEETAIDKFKMDFKTPPVEWTGKLPEEVLDDFKAAETVDDYLKHLDHLDQIEDDARTFFSTGPGSREKITRIVKLPAIRTKDSTTYIKFQAVLDSGDIRMIFLRWDPSGSKVDFDAYSRRGSHSWEDLLSGHTKEAPEIRLGIRADNFYLGEFQDDTIWQSFRGVTSDHEEQISLYIRKDQMSAKLHQVVEGQQSVMTTVSLKAIGTSHQRKQFEITEVHQFNWLTLPHRHTKQTPPNE